MLKELNFLQETFLRNNLIFVNHESLTRQHAQIGQRTFAYFSIAWLI